MRRPALHVDSLGNCLHGMGLYVTLLIAGIGLTTGCSSAISMREALRDSIEQAAAVSQLTVLGDIDADKTTQKATDESTTASYAPETPESPTYINEGEFGIDEPQDISLDIETAVSGLSETTNLDAASKAALVEALEITPQADWPVVIDEFTAALTALRPTETTPALYPDSTDIAFSTENSVSDLSMVEENDTDMTVLQEPFETLPLTHNSETTSELIEQLDNSYDSMAIISSLPKEHSSFQETATTTQPTTESDPTQYAEVQEASPIDLPENTMTVNAPTEQMPLSILRPCLAQKVLGWGMVEEFPRDQLCAGSEVIVYFELTGIESSESDEGFETSIETALRLDDDAGNRLHSWSLPPLVEVCASVRRDYFARFFLNLPNNLPSGDHQLVLTVTDTHAGTTAETVLPCAIVPSGFVAENAQ